MLDIAPSADRSPRMPLDFTPYLLAASPPSSCFDFHAFDRNLPRFDKPQSQDCHTVYGNYSLNNRRNGQLKSIIIKSEGDTDFSSSLPSSDSESAPTSPCSPGKMRKRVTFADRCGKALAQVRIMQEPSDQPPTFRPELLASLIQGEQANITDKPPLKLTFSQPASDYLAFRDKIEKNFVSLENVILNDYTVQGTIKVKNISFGKKVWVRYTSNSWESHTDVVASYCPGPGDIPGRPSLYDTFTFSIEIPPNACLSKSIEFAVCYEVDEGLQHWDSNDGKNYGIVWDNYLPTPDDGTLCRNDSNNNPFVFGPSSLADFACWHHIDGSTPYY